MKVLSQKIRVAVEEGNPSIKRIEEKCVKCGMCARICNQFVGVNNAYKLSCTGGKAVCVNCGQCVKACPVESLVVAEEYKQVEAAIADKQKVVVVSCAPAVRVALGEEFGMPFGSFTQGKMVTLLKKLGFKFILDVNFAADLTICQEAAELCQRLKTKQNLPMFTSCCPAWVKFAEIFYPEILPNISTCKSPIGMQGALIKTYFAQKMNIDPKAIVNVVLTPCVAKKFEIKRKEMYSAAKVQNLDGMLDTDHCITTVELAKWAKEKNIDLKTLEDSEFDSLMGVSSGAGAIFGSSGGVMEAAVRTAYSYITKKDPSEVFLNFKAVRGVQKGGIKEADVDIDGQHIKVAAVYGLANARKLLESIKRGKHYDFVEIMSCPGGCVGGGGQPKHFAEDALAEKARVKALYQRDTNMQLRLAHQNPQILQVYREFLKESVGQKAGDRALELLHTYYTDRSNDLGSKACHALTEKGFKKVVKYKCLICGQVFEVEEGQEVVCPVCYASGDVFEKLEERFVEKEVFD